MKKYLTWRHVSFKRQVTFVSLLTIVPLVILILIFNHLMRGPIQSQLLDETTTGINNQITDTNLQIDQIEKYALNLSVSLDMADLPPTMNATAGNYDIVRKWSNQLYLFENQSTLLQNTVLYVGSKDPYVVTATGTSRLDITRYRPLAKRLGKSYNQWYETDDQLYYLQNIGTGVSQPVTLIIALNTKALLKSFAPTVGSSHAYLALDTQNALGNVPKALLVKKAIDIPSRIVVNGDRFRVVARRYSHQSGVWTYYTLLSLDDNFQPITRMSWLVLAVSVAAILAMLGITELSRRLFYDPIHKLVSMAGPDDAATNEDELAYLQTKFQGLIAQQATSKTTTEKNQLRLKLNFISQALQGRFSYYDAEELAGKADEQELTLNDDHPFVFLHIELTDTLKPDQTLLSEDTKLSDFMMNNVIADVAADFFEENYVLRNQDGTVRLFVPALAEPQMRAFFTALSENINYLLGRWVTMLISAPMTDWLQLHDTYATLEDARAWQTLTLKNQLHQVTDLPSDQCDQRRLASDDIAEKAIIEALKAGDQDKMAEALTNFLTPYFKGDQPQLNLFKSIKRLHFDVTNVLQTFDLADNSVLGEQHIIRRAHCLFRPEEVQNLLCEELCLPALRLLTEKQHTTNQRKITQVLDYLQANFSDPDLFLEQTASLFGLDNYVFSKQFKAETGMSYLEYLTNLRIDHAKRALRNSDKRIGDIARESGYQPSYFNRIFKRKVGVTPGEFRKG